MTCNRRTFAAQRDDCFEIDATTKLRLLHLYGATIDSGSPNLHGASIDWGPLLSSQQRLFRNRCGVPWRPLTTCRCFQFQLHATLDGAAIDSARAIDQIKACANAVAVMPSEENQFEAAFFDKVLLTESVQGRVSSSIAPRRLSLHALLPALET